MLAMTKTRTAVAVLVAAAVAAPSAGARVSDPTLPQGRDPGPAPPVASAVQLPTPAASDPVTPTVEVRSSGFDWTDAGLGAAGMLSLLGLGTGVVVVGRRSRRVIS